MGYSTFIKHSECPNLHILRTKHPVHITIQKMV